MGTIEKRKGKKVKNAPTLQIVEPTKHVTLVEPFEPAAKKSKKRPRTEEIQDEALVIRFPSDVSLYSDPGSMLKRADQMLFPEDEARLPKIGASRAVDWGLARVYQVEIDFDLEEQVGGNIARSDDEMANEGENYQNVDESSDESSSNSGDDSSDDEI
ncbi:hypothetical protein LWI29_035519 [Acer saccharum]|uniref:Uncharacterized protein n=1 Tax=Acer saccharum TaxID=4024 RepID=A0AA39RKR3_ACESA|nr:hypothetical protein LWI29_035519 [Acer saccharum]